MTEDWHSDDPFVDSNDPAAAERERRRLEREERRRKREGSVVAGAQIGRASCRERV